MSPVDLSDVVVRARGIERHLLEPETLRRLARSSGLGVLAGALQRVGYWPAPSHGAAAVSAVQLIDNTIEHEIAQRIGVLIRWLGGRSRHFLAVTEEEDRRELRMCVRALAAVAVGASPAESEPALFLSRALRGLVAGVTDVAGLARALARAHHPYAAAIAAAQRESGGDLRSLERAIDQAYAARAVASARRVGGPLLAWVEEGIDLENAWDALAGAGDGSFLDGGSRLARKQHREVAEMPEMSARRRRLARIFAGGPLAGPFDSPELPLASLEGEAQVARTRAMRDRARLDPLGAAPILEVFMRLHIERTNLRCINWGITQGLSYNAIMAGTVAAP